MEERLRNAKNHSSYTVDIEKMKEDVFQKIERNQERKSALLFGNKSIATIAFILIIVPTVALASYYYFADQIFGSKTHFIHLGGEEKWYDGFESDLQFAREVLNDKEFEHFLSLVKEIAPFHLKIAAEQNGAPHPLSQDELLTYKQLNKEIQPYYTKIDKARMEHIESEVSPTIPEHAQKFVSFRIVTPSYMPDGYSFDLAHWGRDITMEFSNGKEVITTHQSESNDSELRMLDVDEYVYEYSLEGFKAKYKEGDQHNGITVLIPKTDHYKSSQIYVAGKLSKDELEKIALSMITQSFTSAP